MAIEHLHALARLLTEQRNPASHDLDTLSVEAILRLIRARRGQSGIVYALSRRTVEETAEHLFFNSAASVCFRAFRLL